MSARRGEVEYHVVAIGVGGLCFIAHPYWHDHTLDDSHFAYPDHGRGWVMSQPGRMLTFE